MREYCNKLFDQAIDLLVNKFGLTTLSLAIFSKSRIFYVFNNESPPVMCLTDLGNHQYIWKINATVISTLHINEIAWICLHECLHYILEHLKIMKLFKSRKTFGIAADIIVNDVMGESFKEMVDEEYFKTFKFECYTGPNTLGVLSTDMSVQEVYDKVLVLDANDKIENHEEQLKNHESWNDVDSNSPNANEFFPPTSASGDNDIITQQEVINKTGSKSGIGGVSQLVGEARARFNFARVFIDLTGRSMLRGSDDDIESSWLTRNRSTISLPTSMGILPGLYMGPDKKYVLDIFLDVSGSVSAEQINMFATFINLIPRSKWIVRAHTFNTVVNSDIKLDDNGKIIELKTGGGTSFNAIANFILTSVPCPDNVIVITDGEDRLDNTLIKNPNHWTWIIDNDNEQYKQFIISLPGKHFRFRSIAKEMSK